MLINQSNHQSIIAYLHTKFHISGHYQKLNIKYLEQRFLFSCIIYHVNQMYTRDQYRLLLLSITMGTKHDNISDLCPGCHTKCLLFLSDFNPTLIFSSILVKQTQSKIYQQNSPDWKGAVSCAPMYTYRRTSLASQSISHICESA